MTVLMPEVIAFSIMPHFIEKLGFSIKKSASANAAWGVDGNRTIEVFVNMKEGRYVIDWGLLAKDGGGRGRYFKDTVLIEPQSEGNLLDQIKAMFENIQHANEEAKGATV